MNRELVKICSGKYYLTQNKNDALGIVKGTARLYIVPIRDGSQHPGRRQELCDIHEGKAFPSYCYADREKTKWCFLITPADETVEIEVIPFASTKHIKARFAEYAGIPNWSIEGFEDSLRSYYLTIQYREEALSILTQKSNENTSLEIQNFSNYAAGGYGERAVFGSSQPMYEALAFLCKKAKIPLVEWEKLSTRLQKNTDISTIAEAANIDYRNLTLDEDWYCHDCGMFISLIEDNPVALFPYGGNQYIIYHTKSHKIRRVNKAIAKSVSLHACLISRPLPSKRLTKRDIVSFVLHSIATVDIIRLATCMLLGVLVGLILPILNQKVYDDFIPTGDFVMLKNVCLLILTFMLGNLTFTFSKKLLECRIAYRAGYALQDAIFSRIFRLPQRFFKQYDSADLAQRVCSFDTVANEIVKNIVISNLAFIFSLVSVIQMFRYSKILSFWGLGILTIFCFVRYIISIKMIKYETDIEAEDGQARGLLYQYIEGIDKLRLAGAEERALLQYVRHFAAKQRAEIRRGRYAALATLVSEATSTITMMVLYYLVAKQLISHDQSMSAGIFMAFSTAFGSFSSAVTGLLQSAISFVCMKPLIDRLTPVITEVPENVISAERQSLKVVKDLSGQIELTNVCFSYTRDSNLVLKNINLAIKPGEYIGIVGESGCGKSTLFKLLLGFESPDSGSIKYDGYELSGLNIQSLRRCIGTVLQSGKLIAGSIYENIAISAEQASLEDVEDAISLAALTPDIEAMPMGLQTLLSENNETISGGQRQRILIARAFCGKPSILLFDEATSALDNVTQEVICKSINDMEITRIIIAHRLSTVRNCDRILVLDKGCIVQDGSYKQLIKDKQGLFYRLAERQITHTGD